MIAFDNGPANGDYVRYIDALTKRAAIAATAGILDGPEVGGATLARVRERLAAEAAGRVAPQDGALTPGVTTVVAPVQTTGFAPPTVATSAASAAAAAAAALMSGEMDSRLAFPTHMKVGLGAIAIGIALVVAGLLWTPFNFAIVAGGGALIAWAVRMMRDASTRSRSTSA